MTYHAPRTVDQALAHMAAGAGAVVAGGTDYFPALRKGQETETLIDISRISGLRGATEDRDGWRIGAATTWSDIIKADLPAAFDGLKAAAREVGSVQIQNAGTIGGNLCNASPAADGVPPLLTLDARVELTGPDGVRHLALADFLIGPRMTARSSSELLTAALIPPQDASLVSGFEKLGSRTYLVISITMTAVVLKVDAGVISQARLAIGACSAVAQRQTALEQALIGQTASDVQVTPDMLSDLIPIDDVRGDAAYRWVAAAEQCQRAIRRVAGA